MGSHFFNIETAKQNELKKEGSWIKIALSILRYDFPLSSQLGLWRIHNMNEVEEKHHAIEFYS
jgi:hypothetical protein